MKPYLKKWMIGISLGVSAASGIAYACGGYFEFDEMVYFNAVPSTLMDTTFRPFFFNYSDFYLSIYESNNLNNYIDRFNEDVEADWYNYTQGKVPKKIISAVLNSSDSATVYEALMKAYRTGSASFRGMDLNNERVRHFLDFFKAAQYVDKVSTISYYDWYDEQKAKPVLSSKVIEGMIASYYQYAGKNDFLENRYWFQVMKAYFYSDNFKDLIRFFEQTENQAPRNQLYYRALGYVAGAHRNQGALTQANYLYSIVFEQCKPLREVAMYNYKIETDQSINDVLALAQNDQEKIAIWAMVGYLGMTDKAINEIFKLNPNAKYLELLAAKSLDEIQATQANTVFPSIAEYQKFRKENVDPSAFKTAQLLANSDKISNKGLWNTYAGVYSLYAGDFAAAAQYIKVAKSQYKAPIALAQMKSLEYMIDLHQLKSVKGQERKLATMLQWYDEQISKYPTYNEEYDRLQDASPFEYPKRFAMQYIAKLYASEKQPILEEIFAQREGFYEKTSLLEEMKVFQKNGGANELEKYGLDAYIYKLDDIFYYQGVQAFYRQDLNKALQYFQQSKYGREQTFFANPFNAYIKDCNDCEFEKPYKNPLTIVGFVEKMIVMKSNIDKREDVYNNAILLGNAFYAASYYGVGRVFYETSKILNEGGVYISDERKALLKNSKFPFDYYTLASKSAINDEQRAKAAYLKAKTERNMYYYDEYDKEGWGYSINRDLPDFKAWNGFVEMKKYKDTNYYKQVMSDCGYFKTYITQRK